MPTLQERFRAALTRLRPGRVATVIAAAAIMLVAAPATIIILSGGCGDGTVTAVAAPAPAPAPAAPPAAPPPPLLADQPRVRVLLAEKTRGGPTMPIRVNGPWELMDARTHEIVAQGPWMQSACGSVIQGIADGVIISTVDKSGRKRNVKLARARIVPKKPETLVVGTRAYRGSLDIIPNADGSMTLVNDLPIEDYLAGVVTAEMFFYWPAEALKAQAVIARTYTIALLLEHEQAAPRPEWDMESTGLTHQEYQGLAGEHPRGIEAVQATAGQILTWNGKVFRTYFHSTCGGHTEACGLVWDDYPTIPPLAGVACDTCKASKYYQWTETIASADIEAAMHRTGRNVGALRDLVFADTNGDGHMDVVTVVGTRASVTMKGNDFRLAVGPGVLKSMFFIAKRSDRSWEFTGHGWGHGAGLCQYGAKGLADLGRTYDAIVKFYYPQTEIRKAY